MIRIFAGFAIGLSVALGGYGDVSADPRADDAIDAVLDDFHRAAADAESGRYFAHFAPDAVFLGTDAGERWTLAEFQEFAAPYFARGQGWTYVPLERHVIVDEGGAVAWFDELLDNESYGRCRGTGVLLKSAAGWRIAHYSLTLVVPNEVAREVAMLIRDASTEGRDTEGGDTEGGDTEGGNTEGGHTEGGYTED